MTQAHGKQTHCSYALDTRKPSATGGLYSQGSSCDCAMNPGGQAGEMSCPARSCPLNISCLFVRDCLKLDWTRDGVCNNGFSAGSCSSVLLGTEAGVTARNMAPTVSSVTGADLSLENGNWSFQVLVPFYNTLHKDTPGYSERRRWFIKGRCREPRR